MILKLFLTLTAASFKTKSTLMKKIFKGLGILLLLVIAFVFYTLYTTGFFRDLDNQFSGKILKKVPIAGAEDMQIDDAQKFMIISSDDRAALRDGTPKQGGLFLLDLENPLAPPKELTSPQNFSKTFYPHGISMIRLDSSTHKIYAINHVDGQHSIEVFHLLNGDSLVYIETLKDKAISSPNDIVALDADRFYFSNDHGYTSGAGKLAEDYLGLRVSNVQYFDGKNYREVADGIAYANGINADPARALLFLSSPRDFLVKVYKMEDNGDLTFIENIDCGTGVDNIEFGEDGKLWIGCHPNLILFGEYAKGKAEDSPSEIITIDYRSKGDYTLETIYLESGAQMSGATVAPTYGNLIFVGNVMDEHFLILERGE